MQAIYVLLLSLFISMVLVPPLARFAEPLGLTDKPGGRKIHAYPIPRTGGIAIAIGAMLSVVLLVPLRQDVFAFVLASLPLFAFGILDDRCDLDYRLKLLGQILAATIVTVGGGVTIEVLPFLGGLEPHPAIGVPLTILVLVGVTNAVNLSDGLDGLAGGIGLLALGCLAILAYQSGDLVALSVCLAIIGSTFGFLRFNTNPAQIFMGDTGSQFLGFGAAVMIIIVTQRADTAVGKLIPLLILGMPILDTSAVMIRRILSGRSPFSPDRSHLHHRLLDVGWTQFQAVVFIYLAQALMVLTAYLMRFSADQAVLLAYLLIAAAVLLTIHLLQRPERISGAGALTREWTARVQRFHAQAAVVTDSLDRIPQAILRTLIPLVLVFGAGLASGCGRDIGWMAVILLSIQMLAMKSGTILSTWVERLVAYVTAATVLLLASPAIERLVDGRTLFLFFAAIGMLTAVRARCASANFKTSTLDVLILILASLLPLLNGVWPGFYTTLVLQSIVMFYAIEVLIAERKRAIDLMRIAVAAALVILSVKGVLC